MALRPCKECGKKIGSSAKTCPNCGKKVSGGVSTGMGCLVIIIALILAGAIGSLMKNGSEETAPPQVVQPKPIPPLTPKQTLEEARKELDTGQPEKVPEMVKPLLADPKYRSQAQQLLNRSVFKMRDQLAADLQKSMFDEGEEVYVKAIGANKETMQFSGPLIGAVWVHQFSNSEVPSRLRDMGIKQISFVNSITGDSWSLKSK